MNFHKVRNKRDAGIAPRTPEIEQRIALAKFHGLSLQVFRCKGGGAESDKWKDGLGGFCEWSDADTALLVGIV